MAAGASAQETVEALRREIQRLEQRPTRFPQCRATGLSELDAFLPGGGLTRGTLTELRGSAASGKTALALTIIAHATRNGELATFIDGKRELYPPAAQALGVSLPRLLVVSPQDVLQGLWATETALASGAFGVVAIDIRLPITSSPAARLEGMLRRLMSAAERGGSVGLWLTEKPWPLPAALRLEVKPHSNGVCLRRITGPGGLGPSATVKLKEVRRVD